jgi:TRAP-type C4-dicarboxylate transport system permease small subunit
MGNTTVNGVSKLVELLMKWAAAAAAVLVVAIVVVNVINVVGRYAFNAPLEWADEVMVFMMVGAVFLAAPLVAWEGAHIRMDMLVAQSPEPVRTIIERISSLACAGMLGFLAWNSMGPVLELLRFDQRSEAAHMPMAIPQGVIPLGLALASLAFAIRAVTGNPPAAHFGDAHEESGK